MASQTITAMFTTRSEAEHAAESIRQNTALAGANPRVLPKSDTETTSVADSNREHDTGFMAALRRFFMPEEDRYAYAEGMRRGSYMVVVETEEAHAHAVMDALEQAGAVDLEAQEAQWRQEGWHGFEPSSPATAGATETPTAFGAVGTGTAPGLNTGSTLAPAGEAATSPALEPAGLSRVPGAMRRAALAKRCFAEPGPRFLRVTRDPGPRLCSAPLREELRAASRPGHETLNAAAPDRGSRRGAR